MLALFLTCAVYFVVERFIREIVNRISIILDDLANDYSDRTYKISSCLFLTFAESIFEHFSRFTRSSSLFEFFESRENHQYCLSRAHVIFEIKRVLIRLQWMIFDLMLFRSNYFHAHEIAHATYDRFLTLLSHALKCNSYSMRNELVLLIESRNTMH